MALSPLQGVLLGLSRLITSAQKEEPSKKTKEEPPKKTIKLGEVVIEGRIQKPQAFYIIPRSGLGDLDNMLSSKQNFIQKIFQAEKELK